MLDKNETIAAIATPLGIGGIGVIRISGEQALTIASKIFHSSKTKFNPRYVYYGTLKHPETQEFLDNGCLIYFNAPNSYTGEDVVEFQLHSSPYVLKTVLMILQSLGARLALKGEFTKQAFFNGKLDLTQVESVIDLIHSTAKRSHDVALDHLNGKLYKHISAFRASIMRILEQIEGAIDFPDEVPCIDRKETFETLSKINKNLHHMLSLEDYGNIVHSGLKSVIVGKPNAGKSSLLNSLIGEERAIVTDIAGTTRDFIDATLNFKGITIKFTDTAGVRETTEDYIERLGIDRVKEQLKTAHCILWVLDINKPFNEEDKQVLTLLNSFKHVYVVYNKSDLKNNINSSDIPKHFTELYCSAKTGKGILEIKEKLFEDYLGKYNEIDTDMLCNVRQLQCIKESVLAIDRFLSALDQHYEDDVLSIDLKYAVTKLGEITGDDVTEEVLDGVFSRFCVGK